MPLMVSTNFECFRRRDGFLGLKDDSLSGHEAVWHGDPADRLQLFRLHELHERVQSTSKEISEAICRYLAFEHLSGACCWSHEPSCCMQMLQLPADSEGLAWIDAHDPGKLLLVPGLQAASITAASEGDEQALDFLKFTAQHFVGSAALQSMSAQDAFCQAAFPVSNWSKGKTELQLALDNDESLKQLYAARLRHMHDLMHQAICEGRLAALQWLQGICHPTEDREEELMEAAATAGQLDIMKHLQMGPFAAFPYGSLTESITDHDCFKWLLESNEDCNLVLGIVVNIAGRGDLHMLIWLKENSMIDHSEWYESVTRAAPRSGSLETMSWLRTLQPPCPWSECCCAAAALEANMPMLQLLHACEPPCPWDVRVYKALVQQGKLSMLHWAHAQEPPAPWNSACTAAAAATGNLALLQWMRNQNPACPWEDERICAAAAKTSNMDMLRWLRGLSPPCDWDDFAISNAVWAGHLATVKCLVAHGCPINGYSAWGAALDRGSKADGPMLQWLHASGLLLGSVPLPDNFSVPLLIFMGDIGWRLNPCQRQRLRLARNTLCTYHSLLRWCRRAVSDPGRRAHLTFNYTCPNSSGQSLLVRLSRLPQELAVLIAIKAGLQHDLTI